ncbi:MAG: hypothetical protein LH474_11050 [Chamaesiphon sp.]|nr:hypothetical protein [Chamaesiphon sp.]
MNGKVAKLATHSEKLMGKLGKILAIEVIFGRRALAIGKGCSISETIYLLNQVD